MIRKPHRNPGPRLTGLNPGLRRDVDESYSEANNGSEPMETVSVKPGGPAIWPIVWAVVTISLILLTLWLMFG